MGVTKASDEPMEVALKTSETEEKAEAVEAADEKKEEASEGAMESEETSKAEGTSKEDKATEEAMESEESQKKAGPDAEKENVNPNTSIPDTPKAGKDKPMEAAAKAPETEDKTEAMEATDEKKEESETASEGKGVLKSTLNLLVKTIRGD